MTMAIGGRITIRQEQHTSGECADCGGLIDGPAVSLELPSMGRVASAYALLHRKCAGDLGSDLARVGDRFYLSSWPRNPNSAA